MRQVRRWVVLGLLLLAGAAIVVFPFLQRGREMHGLENVASGHPLPSDEKEDSTPRRVYESPLAGTWYDADKDELARGIDACLSRVPERKLEDVCALILPHAGYRYSGQTAAYGIKLLQGRKYERVVVLGPSHRLPMENVASVPSETHYQNPLGELPIDTAFVRELKKHTEFTTIAQADHGEHSVQIEVPLLQRVLGSFRLVPIVVGQLDLETTRRMAETLRGLVDPQTLVVASSDFTHYGREFGYVPFRDDVANKLKTLDLGAVEQIKAKNLKGFVNYVTETGATICGRHPIGVLLGMLPEQAAAQLLHYETSGGMTGDYSHSVSYVAIAFTGKWAKGAAGATEAAPQESASLSDDDKRQLLRLARATLKYALERGQTPTADDVEYRPTPATQAIAGAFVTLRKQGQLRGCVGEISPVRPLYKAVIAQAINAGLNDTRFRPVNATELGELVFEVSVLTPPKPVGSAKDIVIGRHGIILEKDGRSAVFLPKVAVEQGWGLEETLNHLARKAGLAESSWRENASFAVFEAVVFGEDGA